MKDLKISQQLNLLKSSRVITHVSVELRTSVSGISSVSIMRVDMSDGMSLIFIPDYKINFINKWSDCCMAWYGNMQ
jgi:hypothetical protein